MNDEYVVHASGAIESPYDSRDYTLSMVMTASASDAYPEEYQTKTTVPVLNQGDVECCVACALASCRYIQEELQEGSASQFSVNYVYGNRLESDLQTDGMFPRQALNTILKKGVCHWEDFAGYDVYDTAKTLYKKDATNYDYLAYPFKISSYYHLYNAEDIKAAVYNFGCAIISYFITSGFDHPDENGYVTYDSSDTIRGNHCVTIIGWTSDNHWIVLNSWGEDYGLNGYCYVPFEYPFNEAWAMTDENRYQQLEFMRDVQKTMLSGFGIKKDKYLN